LAKPRQGDPPTGGGDHPRAAAHRHPRGAGTLGTSAVPPTSPGRAGVTHAEPRAAADGLLAPGGGGRDGASGAGLHGAARGARRHTHRGRGERLPQRCGCCCSCCSHRQRGCRRRQRRRPRRGTATAAGRYNTRPRAGEAPTAPASGGQRADQGSNVTGTMGEGAWRGHGQVRWGVVGGGTERGTGGGGHNPTAPLGAPWHKNKRAGDGYICRAGEGATRRQRRTTSGSVVAVVAAQPLRNRRTEHLVCRVGAQRSPSRMKKAMIPRLHG